ncbi:DUF3224 domain-containing protein [Gluconacetobacter entanii]|uniref:DUF3224 domain-containing protein n=1 Tax=Gluconacetobacter entanii TaxID=108528 RepID=A0ABT3K2P3_9PROT|nr:DUF3224 domain-containing protein [Gluconacetobacter entanii]MCW4589682.1 DUF3224 domain-containing protein [Gluconacetobacter entanii]MCW4593535.1 DUF3224 domain-containing protein [Gluconacetobacter entanii]
MENEALGTFDVTLSPVSDGDGPIDTMAINKTFYGNLQGSSVGKMLVFRSEITGSTSYVAMERVTARLPDSRWCQNTDGRRRAGLRYRGFIRADGGNGHNRVAWTT